MNRSTVPAVVVIKSSQNLPALQSQEPEASLQRNAVRSTGLCIKIASTPEFPDDSNVLTVTPRRHSRDVFIKG